MSTQALHQRLHCVVLNRLRKNNFWVDCAKHYEKVMKEGASSEIKIETASLAEEKKEEPRQDSSRS